MSHLLAIFIIGINLSLIKGQAEFTSDYYLGLAYCPSGVKKVSPGCFGTKQEAEMNALSLCGIASQYQNAVALTFKDFESCTSFKDNFLNSLTASFTAAQTQVNTNNSTAAVKTVSEASCGCRQVIERLIELIADTNDNNVCEAIADRQLDRISTVCPTSKVSGINFFFDKVCDFVTDTTKTVINKAFVAPVCNEVLEIVSEALDMPMSTLKTSADDVKEKVAEMACGALFCQNPDSKICKKATDFEPKGAWKSVLTITGVCYNEDNGGSMLALSAVTVATPLLLFFMM